MVLPNTYCKECQGITLGTVELEVSTLTQKRLMPNFFQGLRGPFIRPIMEASTLNPRARAGAGLIQWHPQDKSPPKDSVTSSIRKLRLGYSLAEAV